MRERSEQISFVGRLVIWAAVLTDDLLIWYFIWRGDADEPCGPIQAWAREKRGDDGYKTTATAKKYFGK